jgi:hypothetical protein
MDIDALLNRKNELIDLRDDEDHEFQDYEQEELDALLELESEIGSLEECARNGVYFIDEDYFVEFAKELALDIGVIDGDPMEWPLNNIDWDAAADELRMDYTEVEYDGNSYLVNLY